MKNRKICAILIMSLLFSMIIFVPTSAKNDLNDKTDNSYVLLTDVAFDLYTEEEVYSAVKQFENYGTRSEILNDVLMQSSMGITIPKIDASKIASKTKLKELGEKDLFLQALEEHGIHLSNSEEMTYAEFSQIEKSWQLEDEIVDIARILYPELKKVNIEKWTYGKYNAFCKQKDKENLASRFTKSQLIELNNRDILIEDTFYLFKEFHNADVILSQSDRVLKLTLEDAYRFNYEMTVGTIEQQQSAKAPNLPSGKSAYYTLVNFPRYGEDWFCNEILTTEYWRNIQSNRTLEAQCTMYGTLYTQTPLMCTNLYGTFSQSQQGAHEGIDFAAASGSVPIYSPVWGVKLTPQLYHQVAIYDSSNYDGQHSYSFLHFSQRTNQTSIGVGYYLGHQGMEGNANGYHVHFEVHDGQTAGLSNGNNDTIGSASPYRLTPYLGEAG